jgi:hypothetical protein
LNAARRDELENFLLISANPGDIETILVDLEETRAKHGRPQLKDLPGVQDSA